jgi:uncharacterized repeat protein (TIGR01451 family)
MADLDNTSASRRTLRWRPRWAVLLLVLVPSLVSVLTAGPASAAPKRGSDLQIDDVSDLSDPVLTNAPVTYHLSVANAGPSPATGIQVTTALPASVRFDPAQSDPACSAAGGLVTCSYPSHDVDAVRILVITVTPSTAGTLELMFAVTAAEPDPNLSNNSMSETTQVVEPTEADLSINIPGSVQVYAGEPAFYPVEVRNAGPATATAISATLELPAGLSLGSPASCTDSDTGTICIVPFGSLPPSTGSVALLQLTASAAGSYTVRARVSAEQADQNPLNNSDSGLVEVRPAADLSVRVIESADPTTPGRPLTYTVTVSNLGPSPAPTVTLVDEWSTTTTGGVNLLSFTSTQGQCSLTTGQSIECALGELASGSSVDVVVRLQPRGTGTITNQARVFSDLDRNTGNNTASETTIVGV